MSGVSRDPNQLQTAVRRIGHYVGTLASSDSSHPVDNTSTGTPFPVTAGLAVLLQPDADCYVSSEFTHSAIATTNSVKLLANSLTVFVLWTKDAQLAALSAGASSAANVKVFKLENA